MTAIISLASVLISIYYSKDKKQTLNSAVDEVTNKLSEDAEFRHEFMSQLVRHPNIRKNIRAAIDEFVAEYARRPQNSTTGPDISEDIT